MLIYPKLITRIFLKYTFNDVSFRSLYELIIIHPLENIKISIQLRNRKKSNFQSKYLISMSTLN